MVAIGAAEVFTVTDTGFAVTVFVTAGTGLITRAGSWITVVVEPHAVTAAITPTALTAPIIDFFIIPGVFIIPLTLWLYVKSCLLSVMSPEAGSPGNWPPRLRPDGSVVTRHFRIAAAPAPRGSAGGSRRPDDNDIRGCAVFVEAVASAGAGEPDGCWLRGIREHVSDAGPVPGSGF